MDLEIIGTATVKERLAECDGLKSFISENDKEPLWDGYIYVYPGDVSSNESLIGRVPVQAKGKKISNRQDKCCGYSINKIDLQKYLQDGGIIYFVVTIDDNRKKTIFYKVLLPYDLQKIISSMGSQKSMTVAFKVLPDDDLSIHQLFLAFIHDRMRQATKVVLSNEQVIAAVKEGGTLQFHLPPKFDAENKLSTMISATTQDFYLYVETKYGIEIPFAKIDGDSDITASTQLDMPVYVNGEEFYKSISYGYENGMEYLYIGETLRFPIGEGDFSNKNSTFKYTFKGSLNCRIVDSNFLIAISKYKRFQVGADMLFDLDMIDPTEKLELQETNESLKKIKTALEYFGVHDDLNMDDLTQEDRKTIDLLILASSGSTITFSDKKRPYIFFTNIKIGEILIRVVAEKEDKDDSYHLYDAFSKNIYSSFEHENNNGEKIIIEPWSLFLFMKAEDFLCANVSYSSILNSIQMMGKTGIEAEIVADDSGKYISVNNMVLEILNAWDSTDKKDDGLLQFALEVVTIMQRDDVFAIINKYQIIRRMRDLTFDEIIDLGTLRRQHCDDELAKCGISIVLGDVAEAQKILDRLPSDKANQIINYPIYRLLSQRH